MKLIPLSNHQALLLFVVLAVPGCAGMASSSSNTSVDQDVDRGVSNWAEVEDFDASRYAEERPAPRPEINHDVPQTLLLGNSGPPGSQSEQAGFRINVFSSTDPVEADRAAAAATIWWQELQNEGELEDIYPLKEHTPPVYQDYRAPYYRVRLGNFAIRADAQRMLELVEDRYPNAFIVPDRVIIR